MKTPKATQSWVTQATHPRTHTVPKCCIWIFSKQLWHVIWQQKLFVLNEWMNEYHSVVLIFSFCYNALASAETYNILAQGEVSNSAVKCDPVILKQCIFHAHQNIFYLYSPSMFGPVFKLRLPISDDTDTVTLGFIGWASVSRTITICVVWSETLWKDKAKASMPLALLWPWFWWGAEKALVGIFVGDEWGLDVFHVWFGKTLFR